ncbi:TipAS antibiotic-recognition domain-containing protein [Legionella tunisiensis]|uniref:TipAS antibiotic-recognition domain-containing protein n=1 Tax=Legionella tunisiensis TaxID=1034944 RepID=UPI00030B452B|nr:TipAS antibiotic-recognition domain-containing protein [Legionella tunisiensis]
MEKNHWQQHQQEGEAINQGLLVKAITNHLKSDAKEVQVLIQRHYEWVKNFWTPTRLSYEGLGQMYLNHPDFRNFYNAYHTELVEFLVAAMKIYAKANLN